MYAYYAYNNTTTQQGTHTHVIHLLCVPPGRILTCSLRLTYYTHSYIRFAYAMCFYVVTMMFPATYRKGTTPNVGPENILCTKVIYIEQTRVWVVLHMHLRGSYVTYGLYGERFT